MASGSPAESTKKAQTGASWAKAIAVVLGLATGIVLLLLVALYVARKPVTAFLAERYLEALGIPSEIAFSDLSFGGFAARVRLGAASAPDFSAERIETRLRFPSVFSVPQVLSARVTNARLHAVYDGAALSFGALTPLLGAGSAGGGTPRPDAAIEDATLVLETPYGTVSLTGNASMADGALQHFDAAVQPASFDKNGVTAVISGGKIAADRVGPLLNLSFSLDAPRASSGDRSTDEAHLTGDLRGLQFDDGGRVTAQGGTLSLHVARLAAEGASIDNAALDIRMRAGSGTWDGARVSGVAAIDGELITARATFAGADADTIDVQLNLPNATVAAGDAASSLTGPAHLHATAKGFVYGRVTTASLTLDAGSESATLRYSASGSSVNGSFRIVADTAEVQAIVAGGDILGKAHAEFEGSASGTGTDFAIALDGSATASATASAGAARTAARSVPILGDDANFASTLGAVLRNVSVSATKIGLMQDRNGSTLALSAPLTATGAGGAKFALTQSPATPFQLSHDGNISGGLVLDLTGAKLPAVHVAVASFATMPTGWRATSTFSARMDYGDFRGIAFRGDGDFDAEGSSTRFTLKRCATVGVDSLLANATPFITEGKMTVCPDPARPLFLSDTPGWRFSGRFQDAAAVLETLQSGLSGGEGRVDLNGNASGLTSGAFEIGRGAFADRVTAPRFQQIAVSGRGNVTAKDVTATLALSARDHALGSVVVRQSLANGAGSATIDTGSLAFVQGQFQPGDISPLLAMVGTRVSGATAFNGEIGWADGKVTSSGHLTATRVAFQSPLGMVRQSNADITFASLIPVLAESGQKFSAERIDSLVPLESPALTFSFTQDAVRLEAASANVAGGRVSLLPMTYIFTPDVTTFGTIKLENVAVTPLLEAASLASRVTTDAHIDGTIPFSSGPGGLRFAKGHIAANAPGRLSIKREALTASATVGAGNAAPPNAVQDFAYQALENLAFDTLEGDVNSQPMGRLGILFHMVGRNDPPQAAEARVSIFDLIQGKAFDKPIPLPKGTPVDLKLDSSINLDELLASYRARPSP